MSYYWFSYYKGSRWNPAYGRSQRFIDTVAMVRNWFCLKTNANGTDVGTGWKQYTLGIETKKRRVEVFVKEFIWDRYFLQDGDIHVRFRLDLIMRWFTGKEVFFDDELIIEFPTLFLKARRRFSLKNMCGTRHRPTITRLGMASCVFLRINKNGERAIRS